jgi:hypothetical protein
MLLRGSHSPAHAVANEDGFRNLQRVQNANYVIREALNTLFHERIGGSSSTSIIEDDASKPFGDQCWSQCMVVILRGAQAVHEDERFACASLWLEVCIVYAFVSNMKERHRCCCWNARYFGARISQVS